MRQADIQRGRDMWLGGWTRPEVARSAPGIYGEAMVFGWDDCEARLALLHVLGNLGNVGILDTKG